MYYRVFLEDSNLFFYVNCDSFRTLISTVSGRVNIVVDKVVGPKDLPKGELLPVMICEVINPQTIN